MKYILSFLVCLLLVCQDVEAMEFQGKSYVVMDSMSGQVLEEKNPYHTQSVASISKIMTAIIAIENTRLDQVVTIDETVNQAWGSGVYIQIGDEITMQDLLYGLLLRSGNDAAMMISVSVCESTEDFVDLMNQKAKELGMEYTTFSNPTGLDEEDNGNVSCAYDMALLMKYCHQNPIFEKINATKKYTRLDGNGTWQNKQRLVQEYEYCVGGKTGFTTQARRTLVTVARKKEVELIVVTLNCGNDFEFHESKFEEYFKKYQNRKIFDEGIFQNNQIDFYNDCDLYSNIIVDQPVTITIHNGMLLAMQEDRIICRKELTQATFFTYLLDSFRKLLYG